MGGQRGKIPKASRKVLRRFLVSWRSLDDSVLDFGDSVDWHDQ
jgi:hypothetical protein